MAFATLIDSESYRIRSSPTYKGDRVERRYWLINGKRFESTRITWGDGSVTVRMYFGASAEPFREWSSCGMWTDPAYLGV